MGKLAGKDQIIGPSTKDVSEPPEMADVAVLVIDNIFVDMVVRIPFVKVNLLAVPIVLLAPNFTPLLLLIITPPKPLKGEGNSIPVVWADVPLYCNVVKPV